jgi:hypothetical protein
MKKFTLRLLSLVMVLALLVPALPAAAADRADEPQDVRIATTVTGGTITPGQDVVVGSDLALTWQADQGRHLESVSLDGKQLDPSAYSEGMTLRDVQEGHQVDVVFASDGNEDQAPVTYSVVNGSLELVQPDQAQGAVLACYAPKEGYAVSQILVDGQEEDLDKYPTAYLFNDGQAHRISVICAPQAQADVKEDAKPVYTIATSALGGSIDGDARVEAGGRAAISYQADPGWKLMEVVVDGKTVADPDPASYTFEDVNENHSIQAVFEKITVDDQTMAAIQAQAADETTVRANSTDVDVDQPLYTITTSVRNGTIDESTGVATGGSITIHYSPNPGYTLRKLTVDGEDVSVTDHPTEYTFTNVNDDHRIYAVYRKAASSDGSGTTTHTSSDADKANRSDDDDSDNKSSTGSGGAATGDAGASVLWLALLAASGTALPLAARRRK